MPRNVRGQLVIARGTVRPRKSVTWPEETNLVLVKFFELDENERVNVNKLKFEEMRKREFELEKTALNQRNKLAVEESRPWPKLAGCDFTPPEIEYGGQSLEKVAQQKRENSVLQALYFNNLPSNPSGPENSATVRFDTKDIPLEDDSQEEAGEFVDYTSLSWPVSIVQDLPPSPPPIQPNRKMHNPMMAGGAPQTEAFFAHQQQNMMMGEDWMQQQQQQRPAVVK